MKVQLLLVLGVLLFVGTISAQTSQYYRVVVPVCDLRLKPIAAEVNYGYDANQLTQLIYNEAVKFIETFTDENGVEWSLVQAIEQETNIDDQWMPYPGWVQSSQIAPSLREPNQYNMIVQANWVPVYKRSCDLVGCVSEDQIVTVPMGTFFQGEINEFDTWVTVELPQTDDPGYILRSAVKTLEELRNTDEAQLRQNIMNTGKNLLGVYYFWGGRSPFNTDMWSSKTQLTGMDCSGITSLVYRTHGVILPRNANDIFWYSMNVTAGPSSFQPGDFLFLSHEDNPTSPYHVMMVDKLLSEDGKNDWIMESSTNSTRVITAVAKFGVGLGDLEWGGNVKGGLIFWGTAFPLGPSSN